MKVILLLTAFAFLCLHYSSAIDSLMAEKKWQNYKVSHPFDLHRNLYFFVFIQVLEQLVTIFQNTLYKCKYISEIRVHNCMTSLCVFYGSVYLICSITQFLKIKTCLQLLYNIIILPISQFSSTA